MRRALKIILIILFIIAVLLFGAWLIARRSAVKSGTVPPTFRQFIGLGNRTGSTPATTPGDLTSDFTEPGSGGVLPVGTPSPSIDQTTSSQFTSGPLSPTQSASLGSGNTPSNGTPAGGGHSGGTSNGAVTTTPPPTPAPTVSATASSGCTDADLTIEFTPDEITRLNALQNRFYAIAATLHSDDDATTELANYDAFKAKADKITELYNYCASTAPRITTPALKNKVSTPFWRDPAHDLSGYYGIGNSVPLSVLFGASATNPGDMTAMPRAIQSIFRVNFW